MDGSGVEWLAVRGWLVGGWLADGAIGVNPELLLGHGRPAGERGRRRGWRVARTHAAAPERLTGVMMTGFALKMVFFGVYVVVMLRVLALRPVPFVVSFTGYFIALVRDGGAVPAAPVDDVALQMLQR